VRIAVPDRNHAASGGCIHGIHCLRRLRAGHPYHSARLPKHCLRWTCHVLGGAASGLLSPILPK
jgi:hypothetical protein